MRYIKTLNTNNHHISDDFYARQTEEEKTFTTHLIISSVSLRYLNIHNLISHNSVLMSNPIDKTLTVLTYKFKELSLFEVNLQHCLSAN